MGQNLEKQRKGRAEGASRRYGKGRALRPSLLCVRSTAAAGQDQKRDDDDPNAVAVIVEQIAEAVIHGISSLSECV